MTIVVIFTVVTEMLEPQWMVFCVQCYSGKAINFIRTLRYKSLCLMSAVWGKTAQILVNFRLIYHDLSEFSTCPAKISPYIYLDEPTMYFFSFFIDGSYFCMYSAPQLKTKFAKISTFVGQTNSKTLWGEWDIITVILI